MDIFALMDTKAEAAREPFPSVNAATALRAIEAEIKDGRMPTLFACDFALYHVGRFDPISMRITPIDPKHIIDLREFVNGPESDTDAQD